MDEPSALAPAELSPHKAVNGTSSTPVEWTNDCAFSVPTPRSLVLVAAILMLAVFGISSLMALLPLMLLSPRFYRLMHSGKGAFLLLMSVFIERIGGTQVRVTGDSLPPGEVALVLSNHRCRVDWFFFWSFFARHGTLSFLFIALKAELRALPLLGWGGQIFFWLFLQRNVTHDTPHIAKWFDFVHSRCWPLTLLVFVEGTDLHPKAVDKGRRYCDARGIARFTHCLPPRSAGFLQCLSKIRQLRQLPGTNCLPAYLHDVTTAYIDYGDAQLVERPNEFSLFGGRLPKQVHFHVRRFALADIPVEEEAAAAWLLDTFREKDKLLTDFYRLPKQSRHFAGPERHPSYPSLLPCALWLGALFPIFGLLCYLRWPLLGLVVGGVLLSSKLVGGLDTLLPRLMTAPPSTKQD